MQNKVKYDIHDDEFVIHNYNESKPFASFFPGIAGLWGKPMWIFYVNRAQGITCMGTKDKDGAMIEFLPANKAYRLTSSQGFRTFIKEGNIYYEPFQNNLDEKVQQKMHITSYALKFTDVNKQIGLKCTVEYFTVPNEDTPALARILTLENITTKSKKIECIDGLPMITPYGSGDYLLKNMSRLAEGWFSGVLFSKKKKIPVYKLSVEPEDRPEILEIKKGNFYAGFYYNKKDPIQPEYIIDPDIVFGQMKDFKLPENFIKSPKFKNDSRLSSKNKTPSGMGYMSINLKAKESFQYYSIIGNVSSIEKVDPFINKVIKQGYLLKKYNENRDIIRHIGNNIMTKSSSEEFNNYAQQTFLDNLLRGGYPVTLGSDSHKRNCYVYSRIHGDMEREYNNFVIMPEYFSQGTGNNRDVNQNRRSDVFFNPEVKDESIIYFANLIQLDGFNPLKILGSKFKMNNQKKFLSFFKKQDHKKLEEISEHPFSLGDFFNFLEKNGISSGLKKEILLDRLMSVTERRDYANPGEGYWSDHWHYIMGLIENYLAVYPENLNDLLLKKKIFTYYDNEHVVAPRKEKYVLFNNKPRQFNAVYIHQGKKELIESRKENSRLVRTKCGKGSVYHTNLIEKLINLCANKYASLDPEGVGIEMESGKPNWCDALNGLPGLFGSSLAETLELKRLINFILDSLSELSLSDNFNISIAQEIGHFFRDLYNVTKYYYNNKYEFWNKTHTLKEKYREKTLLGLSGQQVKMNINNIKKILNLFRKKVEDGINKAFDRKKGVVYTNFENEVISFDKIMKNNKPLMNRGDYPCIWPKKFKHKRLPLFLEGPVHYLRVCKDKTDARVFHKNIKKSEIFDKKLKMYKVNAHLKETSINVGRIKIFTRGWLENESIWMHMEYKYLFELLRNNLSKEYYEEMQNVLVPFMDPAVYGRSIFENVSFIASSGHPEEDVHGQGFVSRLSGSTAEFLSIWISMTSGLKPFSYKGDKLILQFKPQIAEWLFTKKRDTIRIFINNKIQEMDVPANCFMYKFLGQIPVLYHNEIRKNIYHGSNVKIRKIILTYSSGKTVGLDQEVISEPYSYDVRNHKIKRIDVWFK